MQEVLEIYGNGVGCEVCKPALSYMLDMLWCGDHDEDRSARFINDRVHANIQKDGTFSVIPRIRGGVTSPDELRRIADVADKYQVPMVKITGSQRIDLLGVKKEDLPKVWADLGMPSGQAYTKGVRMVKTCVGTDFCRFGTQDSTGAGIELERRFEQLFTPHKVKMATVGCPRNCAEATVKDIGLVGQEGGWQVVVGGAAGKSVRKADLLITVETTEAGARGGGALLPVLPRERELPRAHLRLRRARSASRRCARRRSTRRTRCGTALLDRLREVEGARRRRVARRARRRSTATQFIPIRPMETGGRMSERRWMRVTAVRQHPAARRARGHARRPRDRDLQSRRSLPRDRQPQCPHQGGPLCDGIVTGSSVVCPLHAWKIDLESGAVERPTHGRDHCVGTYPTRSRRRVSSSVLLPACAGARCEAA